MSIRDELGDMWAGIRFILGLFLIANLFIGSIFMPIAYLMGRSNAAYLNHTQGLNLKWYDAVFLNVRVNQEKTP